MYDSEGNDISKEITFFYALVAYVVTLYSLKFCDVHTVVNNIYLPEFGFALNYHLCSTYTLHVYIIARGLYLDVVMVELLALCLTSMSVNFCLCYILKCRNAVEAHLSAP